MSAPTPEQLAKIAKAAERVARLADAIAHLHTEGLLDEERLEVGVRLIAAREDDLRGHISAARGGAR